MGFAWGSRLPWLTVFQLEGHVFKLDGARCCVDSKSVGSVGFLGGKERIRIPINIKNSSLEALNATSLSTLV